MSIMTTPEEFLADLVADKIPPQEHISVLMEKGKMATKLANAAPYNIFLTAITASESTHQEPLTITMQEIFDESLGIIETSVQINFMVAIDWLLSHYHSAGILDKPLLVVYGWEEPDMQEFCELRPNLTAIRIILPEYATSHTKIMLLGYTDGSMRIVISTANLIAEDWDNRTQSLWMSQRLPALSEHADPSRGESATGFREDLIRYLQWYKLTQLEYWIDRIRKSDFSSINVFLVASVPTIQKETEEWGCPRMSDLLRKHCGPIDDRIPVTCQSSSIGSLGRDQFGWVQRDFIRHFSQSSSTALPWRRRLTPFNMIYPSLNNVLGSHDGMIGGSCLPYQKEFDDRQPLLKNHLFQWKANLRHRSQAIPHNKSYARFNVEENCIYWYLLTSANLSKSAWGWSNRQFIYQIRNYEAGVLFLPRFVTGEETFPLGHARNGMSAFPIPYDLPLTPYEEDDKPFITEYLEEFLKLNSTENSEVTM